MKDGVLWGSFVFVFLILASQAAVLSLKQADRAVSYMERDKDAVAVEWVAGGEKQGIFYVSRKETVASFLERFSPREKMSETVYMEDGMSIHTGSDTGVAVREMDPPTKLALGLLLNIHSLTPAQLTLIPGIGSKTADKIYLFLQQEGCIHDLEELTLIPGIKEKKITAMRQYLMVKKEECKKAFSDWTSRQIIVAKKMTKTKTKKIVAGPPRDINRLTPEQLTLVPGIGQKTADKIYAFIKGRGCINDLEELSAISGIKEGKIENMRKYLFAAPECHHRKEKDGGS